MGDPWHHAGCGGRAGALVASRGGSAATWRRWRTGSARGAGIADRRPKGTPLAPESWGQSGGKMTAGGGQRRPLAARGGPGGIRRERLGLPDPEYLSGNAPNGIRTRAAALKGRCPGSAGGGHARLCPPDRDDGARGRVGGWVRGVPDEGTRSRDDRSVAAWGCGGDDQEAEMARPGSEVTNGARPDPVPTSDPREDERQIRQLTDRFYDAFLDGDGETACSLLSEAAERQVVEDPDNAGYGRTVPRSSPPARRSSRPSTARILRSVSPR